MVFAPSIKSFLAISKVSPGKHPNLINKRVAANRRINSIANSNTKNPASSRYITKNPYVRRKSLISRSYATLSTSCTPIKYKTYEETLLPLPTPHTTFSVSNLFMT